MRKIHLVLIAIAALLLAGRLHAAEPEKPPATQRSPRDAERIKPLMADLKTFRLRLLFNGQEEKPYYRLLLTVPNPPQRLRDDPFDQQVQISEKDATKIIDQLADDGFFDRALDGNRNHGPVPPNGPYYTLMVWVENNGSQVLYEQWLPVDETIFPILDGLRKALDGDAAKAMDFLINRLSGMRPEAHKGAEGK